MMLLGEGVENFMHNAGNVKIMGTQRSWGLKGTKYVEKN